MVEVSFGVSLCVCVACVIVGDTSPEAQEEERPGWGSPWEGGAGHEAGACAGKRVVYVLQATSSTAYVCNRMVVIVRSCDHQNINSSPPPPPNPLGRRPPLSLTFHVSSHCRHKQKDVPRRAAVTSIPIPLIPQWFSDRCEDGWSTNVSMRVDMQI